MLQNVRYKATRKAKGEEAVCWAGVAVGMYKYMFRRCVCVCVCVNKWAGRKEGMVQQAGR